MELTQPQTEELTIKSPAELLPFNCEFLPANHTDPKTPHAWIFADHILAAKRKASLASMPGENLAERGIEWSKDVLKGISRMVENLVRNVLEGFKGLSPNAATQTVETSNEK